MDTVLLDNRSQLCQVQLLKKIVHLSLIVSIKRQFLNSRLMKDNTSKMKMMIYQEIYNLNHPIQMAS